jgi:hypothetical protein
MRFRKIFAACILALNTWALNAFDLGDAGNITATIDIDVNALEIKSVKSSDKEIRRFTYDPTEISFFPVGWDWWTDGGVALEYAGKFYGGKIVIEEKGLGGLKAWVKFGQWLKLSAGTDLCAAFADSLDADPGMRVYNGTEPDKWDESINPDNITQDKGVLLEGFFGRVSAALAGMDHNVKYIAKSIPNSNDSGWDLTENRDFQYGGRLAWDSKNWGALNGSYILQYKKSGDNYNRMGQDHLVASAPGAQVFTHNFGLYASLKPFANMGISLGYAGIMTKYLDEFYRGSSPVQTLVPLVLKSGINLNMRYKGIPNVTLRTDNNFSFWTDKNYIIFNINGVRDLGLLSQTGDEQKAMARHSLLWNGLGASWILDGSPFMLSVYFRNLHRKDVAGAYVLSRNEFFVEPKLSWLPNNKLELYAAFNWKMLAESASLALNEQWVDRFVKGASPRATRDVTRLISVPVGMVLKF